MIKSRTTSAPMCSQLLSRQIHASFLAGCSTLSRWLNPRSVDWNQTPHSEALKTLHTGNAQPIYRVLTYLLSGLLFRMPWDYWDLLNRTILRELFEIDFNLLSFKLRPSWKRFELFRCERFLYSIFHLHSSKISKKRDLILKSRSSPLWLAVPLHRWIFALFMRYIFNLNLKLVIRCPRRLVHKQILKS